jgi:hypothetical protein
VKASLAGSIGSGDLESRRPGWSAQFDSKSPIPSTGASASLFHSIRISNAGATAAEINITFSGGDFDYGEVAIGTEPGVTGLNRSWLFEPILEEPVYPPIAGSSF